jgi:L-rhamnose mutarotase
MIRKCFVMQLNQGAEEEYRRRHDSIWKELEETLRAHGVHNYPIFFYIRKRGNCFAYREIEEEARCIDFTDQRSEGAWRGAACGSMCPHGRTGRCKQRPSKDFTDHSL